MKRILVTLFITVSLIGMENTRNHHSINKEEPREFVTTYKSISSTPKSKEEEPKKDIPTQNPYVKPYFRFIREIQDR